MERKNGVPFNGDFYGPDGEIHNLADFLKSGGEEGPSGGGNALNYSLNEQKTNMFWVDGRPIYQKTLIPTLRGANTFVDLEIDPDLALPIKVEGFAYREGGFWIGLPNIGETHAGAAAAIEYNVATSIQLGTKMLRIRNYSSREGFTCFATVWYTKTTD